MPKIRIKCDYCGKYFYKYKCVMRKRAFCNRECMGLYFTGENNPNYNNRWSKEQRERQSKRTKEIITDEIRFKIGSANRGVKFSKERIDKMRKNRTFESDSHPHTEESKKIIGIKSKAKWTKEYREKHRETMEERGYWIPLDQKTDYPIYFKECDWIERMFDRVSKKENLKIKKNGVFSAKNSKGMIRDHIYSRKTGFDNKVFPEIIRHPCNCMIISHGENVAKSQNKRIDSDSQTLEELFSKIIEYTRNWKEQKECIEAIEKYRRGERWVR